MNEYHTGSSIYQLNDDKNIPIKHIIQLRIDRFTTPISTVKNNRTIHLANHDGRDFVTAYMKYIFYNRLTLANVVEEACLGITEEGTKLGKRVKAERLAEQLRNVKHFAETSKDLNKIPREIGEICVYLYTLETFWYKLINSVLGNPDLINQTHLKTLGPFCYLLKTHLRSNSSGNILTVYRGVELTDAQIQEYRTTSECFTFTSFTSASINRALAELFGNTLFIIDLNAVNVYGDDIIRVGVYIASLSAIPDEEEFLIWPSTVFKFIEYEFDQVNKKHIIYLKSSCVPD